MPTLRNLRFVISMLVVSLAMGVPQRAAAQGFRIAMSDALPSPISSHDLIRYSRSMQLSPEQMRAFSDAHDRYKAEFASIVGEGVIARFIERRKAVDGMPYNGQPSLSEINGWLASHESVFAAIGALDAQLFNDLTPALTESQHAMLKRVQLSRERARIVGDELVHQWLHSNPKCDLREVFEPIAPWLTVEQRDAANAVLDAHQELFLARLRAVQQAIREMHPEWRKELDAAGVVSMTWEQAQKDREKFQTIASAWRAAGDKVKSSVDELTVINNEALARIKAVLPAEHAQAFAMAFYLRAYPGSAEVAERIIDRKTAYAELDQLSPEQTQAMLAMRADVDRIALAHMQETAALEDEMGKDERPNSVRADAFRQEQQERLMKLINDCMSSTDALFEAFEAGLPEDVRLAAAKRVRDRGLRAMVKRGGGNLSTEEVEEKVRQLQGGGNVSLLRSGIPDVETPFAEPVSERLCDVIASVAGLDDAQRGNLLTTHEEIAKRHQERVDQARRAIGALRIAFLTRGEGANRYMAFSPIEDVEQAITLEREALTALQALDAEFFEKAASMLGDANAETKNNAITIARTLRALETHARGGRQGAADLRAFDAYVPMLQIALDAASEDERPIVLSMILDRGDEIAGIAAAQFKANREAWHARNIFDAHKESHNKSPEDVQKQERSEAMAAERLACNRRRELAVALKEALEAICVSVPRLAAGLRDSFERAAYPLVFRDYLNAAKTLSRALELTDLTVEQRADLESIASEFHPAYREIQERMIAVNVRWDAALHLDPAGQALRDAAKYEWDHLVFERDELNYGVRFDLLRVLSRDQQVAIGVVSE